MRTIAIMCLLPVINSVANAAGAEPAPSTPFIRVAPDHWTFERDPGGERFIPFGSNLIFARSIENGYDQALDILSGPKWDPALIRRAFEGAQSLNMNVMKVFLPSHQALPDPQPKGHTTLGAMDPPLLERLDYLFTVARETGVYVSLTFAEWGSHGLKWWQEGGTFVGRGAEPGAEFDSYDVFRGFWTALATRYKDEPALFSYNLAVEFYFPGGNWGAAKDNTPDYSHVLADRWGIPAWRAYLTTVYGGVEAVNARWGTTFSSMEDVPQPSFAWVDAGADSHYASPQAMLADYGDFREHIVSAFLRNQTEAIRAVDKRHMITCGYHPHHPAIGWMSSARYLAGTQPAALDMLDYTTVHLYTNNMDYSPGVNQREFNGANLTTRFAYGGKPVIIEEMGHITKDRGETTRESIRLVETLAPHASGFLLWFLSDVGPDMPYGPLNVDLTVNSFGEAWKKLAEPGGVVANLPSQRQPAATTIRVDRLEGMAPARMTQMQKVLEAWDTTPQPVDIVLEGK